MRGLLTVLTVLLCYHCTQAQKKQKQELQLYEKQGGNFSTGLRGTLSGFSHGSNEIGYGAGGHFRLQIVDRVNTEWYADVLTSNIHGIAHRWDYHIGWSVMYYILHPRGFTRKITPYIVAGHCFDHSRIALNGQPETAKARWSSAVQMGAGMHYNITPKFDISLTTQYMLHLGNELHAHMQENGELEIETHKNAGWEGHLLISLSVNYKFLKLWKPRK